MLEPREADVPILFLVLVVLPLVAYFLLGKWSEAGKKRERISLLAQLAADEALGAEAIASPRAIPLVSTSNNGIHFCARCFSPATTRCSRCKSARYCSGNCQIVHWRKVHKQECQHFETTSSCSSPKPASIEDFIPGRVLVNDSLNSSYFGYNNKEAMVDNAHSGNTVHSSISTGASVADNCSAVDTTEEAMQWRRSTDKQISCKANKETSRRPDVAVLDSFDKTSESRPTNSTCYKNISDLYLNGQYLASNMHETHRYFRQDGNVLGSGSKYGSSRQETEMDFISIGGNLPDAENNFNEEIAVMKGSVQAKQHALGTRNYNSSKSMMKVSAEQSYLDIDGRGQITHDSKDAIMRDAMPALGGNGVASIDIMKMMGLRKSTKQHVTGLSDVHKKIKMLFPYEEFMKIFNCDVVNISPRGLLNCGNSCYANAVLQCLTCTKPLIIFLLRRLHSRTCCRKDWCLMCELEQHVMMLRDCGGPPSPSRILLHLRNINCQIGDGSQEDAHEFLRLLVASMQSICLEGIGGENKVDSRLQETTFIQHTFGGRLRSKVKCLRCHHESERYENIMDLTLEILGWVESLEDALTQFTTSEELDGENMYRCGRCATYVQARKQLSIHEAPNILTIVLKRFQEGKYGKINKCITFPDMLDMIPYMTGSGDIPPLYMLYAVVVHLDTFNASFSGHYVAYVKNLQGSWFRIDDTEVHPVPTSQVMSEGAYMLFYTRSCPRPQRELFEKAILQRVPVSARHCTSRSQKPSRQGQSKSRSCLVGPEPSLDLKPENGTGLTDKANGILRTARKNIAQVELSDVTSSDWSLFTSSDEASFTTESTRDSFSTVDYADMCNVDTFSSIFNNLYAPESFSQNTLCRRTFSSSKPQIRFISEERGYVLDSYLATQLPSRVLERSDFQAGQ